MKTMKKILVSLLFFSGSFGVSLYAHPLDLRPDIRQRKEAEKARTEASFNYLDSLVTGRKFVLEADYLQNKAGSLKRVSPSLNFVKVDEAKGVLQTGSNNRVGYNDAGGITTEGNIGNWKIYKDNKSLNLTLSFNMFTNLGTFDVLMTVTPDDYATATITGIGSGRLSWDGHLYEIGNSQFYKGSDTLQFDEPAKSVLKGLILSPFNSYSNMNNPSGSEMEGSTRTLIKREGAEDASQSSF
jgi:Domain of unknown function (DUF4251)